VILTEVVDTVFTAAQDGSQSNMAISSYMKRCPSGPFIEFDRQGFLVAKGDLLYTYGASCRIGEWRFYERSVLVRSEKYIVPGWAYYKEDPGCINVE
jgi:hypothetical protein